jgi:hypothetical protein
MPSSGQTPMAQAENSPRNRKIVLGRRLQELPCFFIQDDPARPGVPHGEKGMQLAESIRTTQLDFYPGPAHGHSNIFLFPMKKAIAVCLAALHMLL